MYKYRRVQRIIARPPLSLRRVQKYSKTQVIKKIAPPSSERPCTNMVIGNLSQHQAKIFAEKHNL